MAQVQKGDPKTWWDTMQSLMGTKNDSAAALVPLANSVCIGGIDKLVDKINQFFPSVASHLSALGSYSPFLNSNVPM